jgi:hypothetical protein
MNPMLIRSLGGATPPRPSADAGTKNGVASTAEARRKNWRRDIFMVTFLSF